VAIELIRGETPRSRLRLGAPRRCRHPWRWTCAEGESGKHM